MEFPDGGRLHRPSRLGRGLKERIRSAQLKASLSVNRELITLYWHIGSVIVDRQQTEGWGKSVVERLAVDLNREFPGMKGFSANNIWRMRAFYVAHRPSSPVLAQPVQEIDGMSLWTAEALNTAFEFLADVASPDFHPLVKHAKDVAAGAVLISAVGSVIIGMLVFGPYVLAMIK